MPTKDQCQELINGTTSTWTTINSVNGRKFTSKTDISKYIFLPAGGCFVDGSRQDIYISHYWTNKLYDATAGYNLYSHSSALAIAGLLREYGLPVRPVR